MGAVWPSLGSFMKLVLIVSAIFTLLLTACGEQAGPTVAPLPSPPPVAGTPTTGTPSPVPENGNAAPVTPAPTPPGAAPGGQVDLNNEFWYGSLSRGGASVPGGMGFWQTGSTVAAVLILADENGETVSLPRMTGALRGYDLAIGHTDAAGDTGTVEGTFDRSQTSFRGTFTLVVGGEASSFGLTMAYDSQLGERLQTQSAVTFEELAERLK